MNNPAGEATFDLKLISDIVMQLNIVRKNTALYPRGHPQLEASLKRLADYLDQHFAYTGELTMAVTRDSLILGDLELPRNNPIFREYAKLLHEFSVFTFSFKAGVTLDELHGFHRILAGAEEQGDEGGGADLNLAEAAAREGLENVRLELLELGRFEFIEENEIHLDDTADNSSVTWQNFIKNLLEKGAEEALVGEGGGMELSGADPDKLKNFLKVLEKKKSASVSYDKAVASYLQELGARGKGLDAIRDPAVKEAFTTLVKTLNPGLRSQLLADHFVFSSRAPGATPAVFETRPGRVILEVLKDVNHWKIPVETRMLSVVDRLALFDQDPEASLAEGADWDEEDALRFNQMATSFLATAGFRKQAYPADRKRLAQNLEEECLSRIRMGADSLDAKSLGRELRSGSLGRHHGQALLDLLARTKDEYDMEELGGETADLVYRLVQEGRFDLVVYLWKELDRMEAAAMEKRPRLSEICREAKNRFWSPENIRQITQGILTRGADKSEELSMILREACQESANHIVEALAGEEDVRARRILVDLLAGMYEQAADEVLLKLKSADSLAAVNMMEVVRAAKDKSAGDVVEHLAAGGEKAVAVEAVKTLIELGHRNAGSNLVRLIQSEDPEISTDAVGLAKLINDSNVTAALVELVKDSRLLSMDFDMKRKREALKALSWIGAGEALPELYSMVSSKKFFNAKEFQRLKVEIFHSLDGYDLDKIQDFIRLGEKSGDKEIQGICRRLAKKSEAGGEKTP